MTSKLKQLKKLVYTGAKKKNLAASDSVLDRIGYELAIIENLGFTDYFIVYARIVEICNDLNLIRSYGRSTAPNSIINYCLDITKIKPLEENLIFERFIHPEQKTLPDIDIDIPDGQLKNVVKELKKKYPEYSVYYFAFTPRKDMNWKDVFYKNILYKKHPFGIIITSEKLDNSSFSYKDEEFYFSNDIFEDSYYTNKIDILGLRYLNRIQLIINEIGEEFHPFKLPLNDLLVFNYFATENIDDIFQLNSSFLEKNIFSI